MVMGAWKHLRAILLLPFLAGSHDDRLLKVHPAAVANSGRRQQAKPLAGDRVNLENRHPPPGPDALQVEPGDDAVVRKAEGEVRVFVEWQHSTPLAPTPARRRPRQPRRG